MTMEKVVDAVGYAAVHTKFYSQFGGESGEYTDKAKCYREALEWLEDNRPLFEAAKETAELLAAVKSEAFAYGRCCSLYQDSMGGFHCHLCGQRTFAMLEGVQALLGIGKPEMDHAEAVKVAMLRQAAPEMLEKLEAILFAVKNTPGHFGNKDSPAAMRFVAECEALTAKARAEA